MSDEWTYSCSEIAKIAHVSRQAVDQWFRKRGKIKKRYTQADFDAYMSRNRSSVRDGKEQVRYNRDKSVDQQMIAQLQAQVRQLDKQIDKKDQEIDRLYTLLDQQQKLTLSSQQASNLHMLDDKVDDKNGDIVQEKIESESEKKRGFWKRLWRR